MRPLAKIGTPKQQLGEFCAAALDLLTQEPTLARLLYFTGLELDTERKVIFSHHMKPVITALLVRLRPWIASGEIRPVDPETAAIGILGVLLSQVQLHELMGPVFARHKSIQELASRVHGVVFTRFALDRNHSRAIAAPGLPVLSRILKSKIRNAYV